MLKMKRIMLVLCTLMLVFGLSMTAHADDDYIYSPVYGGVIEGENEDPYEVDNGNRVGVSPRTGSYDLLPFAYGIGLLALICVAALAKRRKE